MQSRSELLPSIEMIDLALYLKKHKTIIIADTHIGLEEALNKQGYLIPRFQYKKIITRLEKIFSKVKIQKIIINGDLKHEFGTISNQEWRETLDLLDFISAHCNEVILVKGNHDTIIGPIAERKNVRIVNEYEIGDILITHGHKIPSKIKAETIIIGHEHPALGLREGIRTETVKCFLKGEWKRKNLVVQPSLCLVTEGTDILREKLLSPFLSKSIRGFEAWAILEGKPMYFGKLGNL